MPLNDSGSPNPLGGEQTLQALREALRISPRNLPLRIHLGETLLGLGRFEEAEKEFRDALADWPDEVALKLGLASAFHRRGKHSQALVIVEDLINGPRPPARARLLHARLLFQAGEVQHAVSEYKQAVANDPSVADLDLASRLGIGAGPETNEVVDGKLRASGEPLMDEGDRSVEPPRGHAPPRQPASHQPVPLRTRWGATFQ